MSAVELAGTVVLCTTRYQIKKPTTAYLVGVDANWILTLAIDSAAPGLPFVAGAEVSFAIHSPVQLLLDADDECVGQRYAFAVELDAATGEPRWDTLRLA